MRWTLFALALAALAVSPAGALAAPDRFDLGVHDPLDAAFGERDPRGAYDAVRAANIRLVRVPVAWGRVAPERPHDAREHTSPGYQWGWLDDRIAAIARRNLRPVLVLFGAPGWASPPLADGRLRFTPRVDDFATFAAAAARRYSGATPGVPRVRDWQIWNEPNLKLYLDQRDSVDQYRALVAEGYRAIKAVAGDNRVVAGGLAPYAAPGDIAPLRFMRELLCMSRGPRPRPTCDVSVPFDVWAHHPYTSGGPNRSGRAPDDVSLGDLPEMRRLLRAAEDHRHVVTTTGRRAAFWATEFSWDTRGPDPWGVPLARHARWVAEAFHNMWRNDVSAVVWFQLRDNPRGAASWGQTWQAGLYFRTTERYAAERAKPVRRVIRFPFVALPAGRGARVWGRTPRSARATVTIERRAGARWVRVARVRAGRHGVFDRRLGIGRGALVRARVGPDSSLPFRVERTRDRRVNPFGGPLP